MNNQKEEVDILWSMFLGAGLGMVICSISFAIVGTIAAIAWIDLIPPRLPMNSLIDFIFHESPIEIGTIPGAVFGSLFGIFWGVFDSRLGKFAMQVLQGDIGWYKLLRQMILVVLVGSILLSLMGVFVTTALWFI